MQGKDGRQGTRDTQILLTSHLDAVPPILGPRQLHEARFAWMKRGRKFALR